MNEVTLQANIDIGGYAWARYGFVPRSSGEWNRLKEEILINLDRYQTRFPETITHDVRKSVLEILKSNDPKALWDISDLKVDVNGKSLGKRLLIDSGGRGKLTLRDPASIERFNNYVK